MRSSHLGYLRLTLFGALGLLTGGCGSTDNPDGPGGGGPGGGGPGGGGTGASSSSGSTGSNTGGGGTLCEGAVPVEQADGTESGFFRCPDGTVHRAAAVDCNPATPACTGTEEQITCTADSECTEAPNGRCAAGTGVDFGGSYTYCGCVYPCVTDAECSAGSVCVCSGVVTSGAAWPTCQPAGCITNADCESGECGISSFNDGCEQIVQLACRAEGDACRLDSQCGEAESCATAYSETAWKCWGYNCAIGRPLLVDGAARAAATTAREDWSIEALAPRCDGLAPELRAALAAHWSEVAALEHASIGSFARFSLQLLALGAPAELLTEAQRAALDEIEHARIAYALAGAYAGRAMGPGALEAATAPIGSSLREVLLALVEEACVGETVGVAEAGYLAAITTDPVLARVHARIAEDETRHAALAWRVLRWGLERADGETRRLVKETFRRAIGEIGRTPERLVTSRDHALLSGPELSEVRRQAVREVVQPCADAILAEVSA